MKYNLPIICIHETRKIGGNFKLSFYTHTHCSTTELPGGIGCDGVQFDTPVNFEMSVTLNTCENVPLVGSTPR